MSKCQVKWGRYDRDGLQLHVKSTSEVEKSEQKFDVSRDSMAIDKVQDIAKAKSLVQYQRVTIDAKVVKLDRAMEVSGCQKNRIWLWPTARECSIYNLGGGDWDCGGGGIVSF